jgi:hypothetical protein
MAATITDSGNSTALGGSNPVFITSAAQSGAVGDWFLAWIACSNDGSGGASVGPTLSLSGGGGGAAATFTKRVDIVYDPGAAGAGAELIGYTIEVTGTITTGNFQLDMTSTPTEASCELYKIVPGAGEAVSFIAADTTGSTGNASTYSAATVSVTNGDMIFAAASIETDDAITGDTDTTNGSWSTILSRLDDNGADAATMVCSSQYKTVTATGNQDWACTSSTARDSARTYIVLRSAASVPSGHHPYYSRFVGRKGGEGASV